MAMYDNDYMKLMADRYKSNKKSSDELEEDAAKREALAVTQAYQTGKDLEKLDIPLDNYVADPSRLEESSQLKQKEINEEAKSPYMEEKEDNKDLDKMLQSKLDSTPEKTKQNKEKIQSEEESQDFKSDLLERLGILQKERKQDIEAAREQDYYKNLLANAVNLLGTSMSNRYGMQGVPGVSPTQFKYQDFSNIEDQMKSDYDSDLKNLMEEYKILSAKDKDELSAKDKAYLDYYRESLDLKKESQKEIAKRQQNTFDQRDIDRQLKLEDRVYGVTKDFEKDDVVKELKKQGIAFDQMDSLLKEVSQGNEIALGSLGTKAARAMGEVGVLTDADVKRYIQAQSIPRSVLDVFNKNFRGKLSDLSAQEIQQVADIMRIGFKNKKASLYDKYVKKAYNNYGKRAGMTIEDVESKFGFTRPRDTISTEKITVELPNGRVGKIDSDKVEAFIKKYPEAKVLN